MKHNHTARMLALEQWANMTIEEKHALHKQSDAANCSFEWFQASSNLIERALLKRDSELL